MNSELNGLTPEEIKNYVELQCRKLHQAETSEYTKYVQTQFNLLKWVFTVLIAAAAAIFIYFFGEKFKDIDTSIASRVDERVLAYKIDQKARAGMEARLGASVDLILSSDATKLKIEKQVEHVAQNLVSNSVTPKIEKAVDERLKAVEKLTKDDLARIRAAVPIGVIIPFAGSIQEIPQNWILCDGRELSRSAFPDLFCSCFQLGQEY